MSRSLIASVLERHAARCLDDAEDRAAVAEAICDALRSDPEATVIRQLFEPCQSSADRFALVASNGKRLGVLVDAASTLAGVP